MSLDFTSRTFADFCLAPEIMRALAAQGYTTPTPIQAQAIPLVLQGRDVMGAAQTGTGKTASFSLPIIHNLLAHANTSMSPARHPVRALILTPTRELADQVADNVKSYAQFTSLRSAVVFGGVDIAPQEAQLRAGVEILIATPGRLLDHIQQKTVSLAQTQILILDEADRMLDMGFLPDLQRIVQLLPRDRQSLMFSATFSTEIKKLANSFLRDPVSVEVARSNATSENIEQILYRVKESQKGEACAYILKERDIHQAIIFTNTKMGATKLSDYLIRQGIKSAPIHGDKTQNERMLALDAFKNGGVEILVATDVAARGLDISAMPCVVNYDLPFNAEDYVHRIGRTGRAGSKGVAMSLLATDSDKDERFLQDIEKLTKHKIQEATLAGFNDAVEFSHYWENKRMATADTTRGRVDPFFYKPYQANTAPRSQTIRHDARVTAASTTEDKKVQRAALLGGGFVKVKS